MKVRADADKYYSKEARRALCGPKGKLGGRRPGSGRPPREDKAEWGQITCILKKKTIAQLKAAAGSKHFGECLQEHLDRYPLELPTPRRKPHVLPLGYKP